VSETPMMCWCACGEKYDPGKWTRCPSCGAAPGLVRAPGFETTRGPEPGDPRLDMTRHLARAREEGRKAGIEEAARHFESEWSGDYVPTVVAALLALASSPAKEPRHE